MSVNSIATLGIKVDPKGAIAGASKAKNAILGIRNSARKAKDAIFSAQGAMLALGAVAIVKGIISTASSVENLKIQLKFLTGSTEDAATAFKVMEEYAKKVPFSLANIQSAVGNLATVTPDIEDLNEILEITGDIAAASGLEFDEVARQLQRSFSSGIAAAEIFKEKGVAAMLGFEQGVASTGAETKKKIIGMWRDSTAYAKGATDALQGTFTSSVSMMEDAWFNLQLAIADVGILKEATEIVEGITATLRDPKTIAGAKEFATALLSVFEFIVQNADILISVGKIWLASKLFAIFGKQAALAAGATMGLYEAFNLLTAAQKEAMQSGGGGWAELPPTGAYEKFTKILLAHQQGFSAVGKEVSTVDTNIKKLTASIIWHHRGFSALGKEIKTTTDNAKNLITALEPLTIIEFAALAGGFRDTEKAAEDMKDRILEDAPLIQGAAVANYEVTKAITDATIEDWAALGLAEKEKWDAAKLLRDEELKQLQEAKEQKRLLLLDGVADIEFSLMTTEERLNDSLARRSKLVNDAFTAGLIKKERADKLWQKLEEQHQKATNLIIKLGLKDSTQHYTDAWKAVHAGFVTLFTNVLQGEIKTFSEFVSSAFDVITAALIRLVAEMIAAAVFSWLIAFLFPAKVAKAIQVATTLRALETGRQFGGTVEAGKPYMVGEAGREVFVPRESGKIVPINENKASNKDVVRELRELRGDLANVITRPIVGQIARGQMAIAGGARH